VNPAAIIWRTGGWIGLIVVASLPDLVVSFGLFTMYQLNSNVPYLDGKH